MSARAWTGAEVRGEGEGYLLWGRIRTGFTPRGCGWLDTLAPARDLKVGQITVSTRHWLSGGSSWDSQSLAPDSPILNVATCASIGD